MQTQLGLIWRLAGARAPLPWEMSAEKAAEGLRVVVRRRRGMLMPTLSLHGNANANATARQPHARGISKHAAVAPGVGCPRPAVRPMLPPAWPKDGYSCRRRRRRGGTLPASPGADDNDVVRHCFPLHVEHLALLLLQYSQTGTSMSPHLPKPPTRTLPPAPCRRDGKNIRY